MGYEPNQVKEIYDSVAELEDKQEHQKSLRVEIPRLFIKKYLSQDDVVLDAGGGTGVNSVIMAKVCKHVTLLDISPKILGLAKKNVKGQEGKIKLVQGDISDMSVFPDNHFSFVVCVGDSISYVLEKRFDAMKELSRVIKNGSIMIIGCDSKLGFIRNKLCKGDLKEALSILETNKTKCDMGPETYVYSIQKMSDLLRNNGFEILEIASTPTFTDTLPSDIVKKYKQDSWSDLINLEMELCTRSELLGVGCHLLFVVKKSGISLEANNI